MRTIIVTEPQTLNLEDEDGILCVAGPHCHYEWILDIRRQCIQSHTIFKFVSTGPSLIKNNREYHIPIEQQKAQAKKANIDYSPNEKLFQNLSHSNFRSSFHLKEKDRRYVDQKGLETIDLHAHDFIAKRLAPKHPNKDGKQTPMRGHPVFLAQHATGTCCRNCLYKWHHIPKEKDLTNREQDYICQVIMDWIVRQMNQ